MKEVTMDTFETFKEITDYTRNQLITDEPTCFNGMVRVRKYKVTVEVIEEPIEVIQARIQKMWDECNNHHHWRPLKDAAKQYGLEL